MQVSSRPRLIKVIQLSQQRPQNFLLSIIGTRFKNNAETLRAQREHNYDIFTTCNLSVLCVFAFSNQFEFNEDAHLLRCSQIKINNLTGMFFMHHESCILFFLRLPG